MCRIISKLYPPNNWKGLNCSVYLVAVLISEYAASLLSIVLVPRVIDTGLDALVQGDAIGFHFVPVLLVQLKHICPMVRTLDDFYGMLSFLGERVYSGFLHFRENYRINLGPRSFCFGRLQMINVESHTYNTNAETITKMP